jgi:hypothetical protein
LEEKFYGVHVILKDKRLMSVGVVAETPMAAIIDALVQLAVDMRAVAGIAVDLLSL